MGRGQWSTLNRGAGGWGLKMEEARHSAPGHIGLEKQFVSKESIRVHVKCDIEGDLELEKEETVTRVREKEQPKCPSAEEWVNKMGHIRTTEYYSAVKRI